VLRRSFSSLSSRPDAHPRGRRHGRRRSRRHSSKATAIRRRRPATTRKQPPPRPTDTAPPPQPTYTAPPPQPTATTPPAQPTNPANAWLGALGHILQGGAPPWPPPAQPTPPPPTQPTQPAPTAPAISARSLELANAINQYRAKNGLPAIPISKSLSTVAEAHAKDLRESPKVGAECNGHSWSNKGPWSPCCYTPDHAQAKCMWNKPAEITAFKATGFEITIGQPGEIPQGFVLDSPKAISAWQGSALHNDVILNRGTWQTMTWRAMGAGIVDSHACAWFSDQTDPVQ
jgi:hypothetical protein